MIAELGTEQPHLICPNCGSENVHMYKVEVFIRDAEDCEEGTHTEIQGLILKQNPSMKGNPSGRRNGVKMTFTCEQCPQHFNLLIAQHKGWEMIETRTIPLSAIRS